MIAKNAQFSNFHYLTYLTNTMDLKQSFLAEKVETLHYN